LAVESGTRLEERWSRASLQKTVSKERFSEETGLKITDPTSRGVLHYYKADQREKPDWTVYLFVAEKFRGVPADSREGTIRWFEIDELPLGEMWEDYQHWYRHLLGGKKLEGGFYFSGDFEKLRDHWLKVL